MVWTQLGPNPGNIRIKGGIKEGSVLTPKMGDFRGSRLGLREGSGGADLVLAGTQKSCFSVSSVLFKKVITTAFLPIKRFLGVPQKGVILGSF